MNQGNKVYKNSRSYAIHLPLQEVVFLLGGLGVKETWSEQETWGLF